MSVRVHSGSVGDPKSQILDAAKVVFTEKGVTDARMGRIAEEAGFSRATVYRYFRTKDDLIRAYAERAAERSRRRLTQKMRRFDKLSDRLVEAVAFTAESIRNDPEIAPFFEPDALAVTGSLPFRSAAMLQGLQSDVRGLIEGADTSESLRDTVRAEELGEWLVRLGLSLAMVRGPSRKSKELRGFIRRLVMPAFIEVRQK